MDKSQANWNKIYKMIGKKAPKTDNWLDKFLPIIKKSNKNDIIDLGCGSGNDTFYLTNKGFSVLSCDYSEAALERLKHFIDNPKSLFLDMREPLPFDSNSIKIIISDLSIHYFDTTTTNSIIKEIRRVLKKDGILICRVNSTKELANESNAIKKIENNFYLVGHKLKRYFSTQDIHHFFHDFKVAEIKPYTMARYSKKKHVIEFTAKKLKIQINKS